MIQRAQRLACDRCFINVLSNSRSVFCPRAKKATAGVHRQQNQNPPIADAAVVCSGWLGVNALLTDGDCCDIIPTLCKEKSIMTTTAAPIFIPQKIPRHSPSSLLGGTGSQDLRPSLLQAPVGTHLGWISRWSGDGLVVMEDDEDQVPVTVEEMPAESWH